MALISSILEQALRRTCLSGVPEEVKSLYTLHTRKGTNPTLKQLSDVFSKLFSQCSNIFIVIDALDECSLTDDLAIEFVHAVQALGNNVRLLITSRTSTNFESAFREAVRIDIAAQEQDVRLYLETKIPERSRLAKHIRADPKLQDDIIESIAESAQGMFLLVALNLHSLSRKLTRRDIRASLSVLRKTLDATYEQALEKIRTQAEEDVELAETVIMWILCARRPLSVLALQHAYAVHLLSQDGDGEPMSLEDDDLPPKEIITGVCGGLITVDGTSQIVRLVHYTTQDYLLRTHGKDLHRPRLELTKVSLDDLQLRNFSDEPALSDDGMAKRLEDFTFLEYAAKQWGSELHQLKIDTFWEFVDRFLSNEVAVNVASQAWGLPQHRYTNWSHEFATNVPAVVLAASFNIPEVLERLKSRGHDIEASGSDGETPLIRSSRLGHAENISTLLRLGANIAAVDDAGETSIERATAAGRTLAVKALIDEGANVNTVTGTAGWSLLMSAVSSGNIDTVRLLVDAEADLTTQTSWGETALSLAVISGQEVIAGLLVDAGAILPLNRAGRRATLKASRRGLVTLASRLMSFNGDYRAVADVGVRRQSAMGGSQLAQIAELDEPENDDLTGQRQQPSGEQDIIDVSHELALEWVPYLRELHRRYSHLEKIARGHSAEVFSCRSKVTGVKYAAKIFSFTGPNNRSIKESVISEVQALTDLRNANILGLIDVAVTDGIDALCLVLELSTAGDFFTFIVMKEELTEANARTIFIQLMSAICYMVRKREILLSDTCSKNSPAARGRMGASRHQTGEYTNVRYGLHQARRLRHSNQATESTRRDGQHSLRNTQL
ncbi:ankyrin [Colletotrichum musicola]|uniref:Ankyrin n=1 Tax=Colletotrichum musicola TaxID=2175873 RepID=A0A8H6IPF9_9PEZI|nr:ankyrin [Colletotrichum musicola]